MLSITLSNKEWRQILEIIDETIHQGWSRYDDPNHAAFKLMDNMRWAEERRLQLLKDEVTR
jgi:hypothetical protein